MSRIIRIAIADDYELVRKGIAMLLNRYKEFEVVIEATSGPHLLRQMDSQTVDVVILDYQMPEMDGLEVTKKIKKKFPGTKIIILTFYSDFTRINSLVKEGASGFLLKNAGIEMIVEAVHKVMNNDYYFNDHISPALIKKLLSPSSVKRYEEIPTSFLTQREIDVIQLLCEELTTQEIAERLCVSKRTIEGYREKLIEKLKVKNTAGIIMYAVKNNIVP